MKLTEVKYTKRFNLGNYEHEEITVGAVPEEGETIDNVLDILRMTVDGMPRVKSETLPTISKTMAPPPPPPQVNRAPQNLGAYVIPIGKKYKGQRLDEVDIFKLDGYCKWLVDESKKKNEQIKGPTKDFLDKAEQFLNSRERQR